MALSGTGRELWPPLLRTSSRKLTMYFFARLQVVRNARLPPAISPQPPSFRQNSASINERLFFSSQSTPLYGPPPSSSAVSATIRSRSGLNPSFL